MNTPENITLTPAQKRALFAGVSLRKAKILQQQKNKIAQQQQVNYALEATDYNNQINLVGQQRVMLLAAQEAEKKKKEAEENRLLQLALQKKKKNNSTGAMKYAFTAISATTILGALL